MSSYTDLSTIPTLISAKFDTSSHIITLQVTKQSIHEHDVVTWDLRYGEELDVLSTQPYEDGQILTCQLRKGFGPCSLFNLELKNYMPGQVIWRISTCIGEFDTML